MSMMGTFFRLNSTTLSPMYDYNLTYGAVNNSIWKINPANASMDFYYN